MSVKYGFSEEVIQQVWEKGNVVSNYDASKYRKDNCGAWMIRTDHGNRDSLYGWEIHHVNPKGGDDLSNLIPLQWENNVATADTGGLVCVVTSSENKNVKK
jgi:hypothetical protein